jgi:DNA replication and repair protein RecF
MKLTGIWLQNFRSFSEKHWAFKPGLNVLAAPNGSGKSNLIEAIELLSAGESWRADRTEELIRWDSEFGRIKGKIELDGGEKIELEQVFTAGSIQGKRTNKRLYRVNNVGRRANEATGQLQTVLFTPEDMNVFQAGPSARRRLLDRLLDQVCPDYRRSRRLYEQALRRRNKLILQLRAGEADRYDFFAWDRLLIEHGSVLHAARAEFLQWLNARDGIREPYRLTYDHSVISEERLRYYAQAEVGAGHTLVGPHKDDWKIEFSRGGDWRDIEHFGSRGEQRLALVWWKLSELEYLRSRVGEAPVLLLDDVFSELDAENQAFLLQAVEGQQAVLTCIEIPATVTMAYTQLQ